MSSCIDSSFGLIPHDTSPSNIKVNNILATRKLAACLIESDEIVAAGADIDNAYIDTLTVQHLNAPIPIPPSPSRLVLGFDGNLQFGSFGEPLGGGISYAYFGSQLGPVDPTTPARLLPVPTNGSTIQVLNDSGFSETIAESTLAGPTQGAPGWQVPVSGLYRIDVSMFVQGITSIINPAPLGSLGVGSPLNVILSIGKNGSGGLGSNQITQLLQQWNSPPTSNGDIISQVLGGFIYTQLLTSDVLYIGVMITNQRQAILISNARASLTFVQ